MSTASTFKDVGSCVSSCVPETDLAVYYTASATDPKYCIRKANGFDPKPSFYYYVKSLPTASNPGETRPCMNSCFTCVNGDTCKTCDGASIEYKYLSFTNQCVSSCTEGYPNKQPGEIMMDDGKCLGKSVKSNSCSLSQWLQILFQSLFLQHMPRL